MIFNITKVYKNCDTIKMSFRPERSNLIGSFKILFKPIFHHISDLYFELVQNVLRFLLLKSYN